MKHISLLFLSFLFLIGCDSNVDKHQIGPLSQINNFEVCAFFPSYEKVDRDLLFKALINCLKTIGTVDIIKKEFTFTSNEHSNIFFLSLINYQKMKRGVIDIISSVEIKANRFKTDCSIGIPIQKMKSLYFMYMFTE
jgi:hypothetical protein